jgi:hypothetical protein
MDQGLRNTRGAKGERYPHTDEMATLCYPETLDTINHAGLDTSIPTISRNTDLWDVKGKRKAK